jgi:hypothetical protein
MRFPSTSSGPRFTSHTTVELRAAYSVPELAGMANIHRHRMRRLLEAGGVEIERNGRSLVVYQTELEERMPKLWNGIVALAGIGAQYSPPDE